MARGSQCPGAAIQPMTESSMLALGLSKSSDITLALDWVLLGGILLGGNERIEDPTEDLLEALTTDDEPLADYDEPAQFVKGAEGVTLQSLPSWDNAQAVAALRAKCVPPRSPPTRTAGRRRFCLAQNSASGM